MTLAHPFRIDQYRNDGKAQEAAVLVLSAKQLGVIGITGMERWSRFLSEFIGRTKITVADLNRILRRMHGHNSEHDEKNYRHFVERQLKGFNYAGPLAVWDLARALRYRLPWLNGLLALYISQHFKDYVGVIANLPPSLLMNHSEGLPFLVKSLRDTSAPNGEWVSDRYRRLSEELLKLERAARSKGTSSLFVAIARAWKKWHKSGTIPNYAPRLRMLLDSLDGPSLRLATVEKHIGGALIDFIETMRAD